MVEIASPPPPTWGNDTLTRYLDNCRVNQWATFANKRSEVIDLTTIDGMFRRFFGEAVNPKPILPANFLLRSHSAYLSACGAVMAGQLHDAWSVLRVSLEQGGYAYYVGGDRERWTRWLARHDVRSRTQQSKWKDEFTHGRVLRHLRTADPQLAEVYSGLYDRTIDYGAHPNERGISVGMNFEDTLDGGRRFNTIYLHGEGPILNLLLKSTAQVGICVLRIAQLIYPERTQATGVKFTLETIRKQF